MEIENSDQTNQIQETKTLIYNDSTLEITPQQSKGNVCTFKLLCKHENITYSGLLRLYGMITTEDMQLILSATFTEETALILLLLSNNREEKVRLTNQSLVTNSRSSKRISFRPDDLSFSSTQNQTLSQSDQSTDVVRKSQSRMDHPNEMKGNLTLSTSKVKQFDEFHNIENIPMKSPRNIVVLSSSQRSVESEREMKENSAKQIELIME